ncbi:hypothetical protein SCP_0602080 [Sparassis crispa]|uniref:Uncharacterized protein n=1 Tax=Sparassis crispa TaxID=139825 RepID=A0A401GPZ6_9APHY|nr:hypothetical protein SCP_0602080 [Sparassis crispa]GBE84230.1 hypothetical protein SCP_0602080 [Sparassis crispa]
MPAISHRHRWGADEPVPATSRQAPWPLPAIKHVPPPIGHSGSRPPPSRHVLLSKFSFPRRRVAAAARLTAQDIGHDTYDTLYWSSPPVGHSGSCPLPSRHALLSKFNFPRIRIAAAACSQHRTLASTFNSHYTGLVHPPHAPEATLRMSDAHFLSKFNFPHLCLPSSLFP